MERRYYIGRSLSCYPVAGVGYGRGANSSGMIFAPTGSLQLGGEWLEQRPAQLLKLLLADRARVVTVEEIAERLWERPSAKTVSHVRHCVYAVRRRIEPDRDGRQSIIVSHRGGYTVDARRLWIDADEFEVAVETGTEWFRHGHHELARAQLSGAIELYRGDFLEDEPYADWALPERNRLMSIASNGLRVLAAIERNAGNYDAAAGALTRLARIDGDDVEVERELMALCLLRGRRSEARRRYAALSARLMREFGEKLDFELSDVGASAIEERLLA